MGGNIHSPPFKVCFFLPSTPAPTRGPEGEDGVFPPKISDWGKDHKGCSNSHKFFLASVLCLCVCVIWSWKSVRAADPNCANISLHRPLPVIPLGPVIGLRGGVQGWTSDLEGLSKRGVLTPEICRLTYCSHTDFQECLQNVFKSRDGATMEQLNLSPSCRLLRSTSPCMVQPLLPALGMDFTP